MKVKKLNLKDALSLASIVSKYVNVSTLDSEKSAIEFIDEIIQSITPEDFLECIKKTTYYITEKKLEKLDGLNALALFSAGLRENKIITLLSFYKSLDSNGK